MTTGDTIAFPKKVMKCQRCNSWMEIERFYGPNYSFFAWHCLLCGDILDPVILLNRLRRRFLVSPPEEKDEFISTFKKWMEGWPEPV